jgi:hypothetical protein
MCPDETRQTRTPQVTTKKSISHSYVTRELRMVIGYAPQTAANQTIE